MPASLLLSVTLAGAVLTGSQNLTAPPTGELSYPMPEQNPTPGQKLAFDADSYVLLARSAPERPSHFAEREELAMALETRTPEALELFLERHPQSRYRPAAERALRRLLRNR